MNKTIFEYIFVGALVTFILITSVMLISKRESIIEENIYEDKEEKVKIDNNELDILYYNGNKLDLNISYGNVYEKIIRVTNFNDQDIVYSIKINNAKLSNDEMTYDIYLADKDKEYTSVVTNSSLLEGTSLTYNLVSKSNTINFVKIVFKSNHEKDESNIKGVLSVTNNITSLELFNNTIKNINDALELRIDNLNGIYTKGYYLLNINELSFNNDADVSGYILIDASDISDIKYIYTIYNNMYMVKNNNYDNLNVINVDNGYVSTLNNTSVCHQYDTRITCNSFNTIPKSSIDDKKKFFNNSKLVINDFLENNKIEDDRTYIYEVNNYNVTGYILVNKDNMFLYLKDNMFMISGYNYKKLGDYNINSKTIRSYTETAWNISSSDKKKVCSFSGYSDCYDKEGNRV